ncbi:MAG: hypothetical protein ABIH25_04985 [Candidatus Woesearchaeota archaeon]
MEDPAYFCDPRDPYGLDKMERECEERIAKKRELVEIQIQCMEDIKAEMWERRLRDNTALIGIREDNSHTHIGPTFIAMRAEDDRKNRIIWDLSIDNKIERSYRELQRDERDEEFNKILRRYA